MEQNYTGIILNKKDLGETDRLYFIYTLEGGLVKAVARGVRKPQAKLSANLENFNLIRFSVIKNKGMGNITNVVVENYFNNLKKNLETLTIVFQTSQLFNRWIVGEQEEKKIFNLWKEFLSLLNSQNFNQNKRKLIYLGFLFQTLNLLGYRLEVNYCVDCRQKISNDSNYFSAQKGGILCKRCGQSNRNKFPINSSNIKVLRLFFSNRLSSLPKIKINSELIKELENILDYFIKWI